MVHRSLTRAAGMDSQLPAEAESTPRQWEPPAVVEVALTHGRENRAHMELDLGPGMRGKDVRSMGVNDPQLAPLLLEPSTTEKRGNNYINVYCSAVVSYVHTMGMIAMVIPCSGHSDFDGSRGAPVHVKAGVTAKWQTTWLAYRAD